MAGLWVLEADSHESSLMQVIFLSELFLNIKNPEAIRKSSQGAMSEPLSI